MGEDQAFATAVHAAIRAGQASGGANLAGMEADLSYYVSMLPEIDERTVKIKRTGRPDALLEIECRTAAAASALEAAEAVQRLWLEQLRYPFSEAHRVHVDGQRGTFRFLTQMSDDGLFVTGVMTITSRG